MLPKRGDAMRGSEHWTIKGGGRGGVGWRLDKGRGGEFPSYRNNIEDKDDGFKIEK